MSVTLNIHQFSASEIEGELFRTLEFKGTDTISDLFSFDVHCVFYHNVFDYQGRSAQFFNALNSTQATLTVNSPVAGAGVSSVARSYEIRGYVDEYEVLSTFLDPQEAAIKSATQLQYIGVNNPFRSYALVRVTIRPLLALLDKKVQLRAFVGQRTKEIVEFLLEELTINIIDPTTNNPVGAYSSDSANRLIISNNAFNSVFFTNRLNFVLQNNESSFSVMRRLLDEAGLHFYVSADSNGETLHILRYDDAFEDTTTTIPTGSSTINSIDVLSVLTRDFRHVSVPAAVEVLVTYPGEVSTPIFLQEAIETDKQKSNDTLVIDDFYVERFILEDDKKTREEYGKYALEKLGFEKARFSALNDIYSFFSTDRMPYVGKTYTIENTATNRNVKVSATALNINGRSNHFITLRDEIANITDVLSEDELVVRMEFKDVPIDLPDFTYMPAKSFTVKPASLTLTGFVHSVPSGTTFSSVTDWRSEAHPDTDGLYGVILSDIPIFYSGGSFDSSSYDFSKVYEINATIAALMPKLVDYADSGGKAGMDFILHNGSHVSIQFMNGNPELPFIAGVMGSPVVNQQHFSRNEYEDNLLFDPIYKMQTRAGNLLQMNTSSDSSAVQLRSRVAEQIVVDDDGKQKPVEATSGGNKLTLKRADYSAFDIVGSVGNASAYLSVTTTGLYQDIMLGGHQFNILPSYKTIPGSVDSRFGFVQSVHPTAVLEVYKTFNTQPLEDFYARTLPTGFKGNKLVSGNVAFLSYPTTIEKESEFEGNFLFERDIGDVYSYQDGVKYIWHNKNDLYQRGCYENVYFSAANSDVSPLDLDDKESLFRATNTGKGISATQDKGKVNTDRKHTDVFTHVWGNALFAVSGHGRVDVHGVHKFNTQDVAMHGTSATLITEGDITIKSHQHKEVALYMTREEEVSQLWHNMIAGTYINMQMDDKFYFSLYSGNIHSGVYAFVNPIGADGSFTIGLHIGLHTTHLESSGYHGEKAILDSIGIATMLLGMVVKGTLALTSVGVRGVSTSVSAVSSKIGTRVGSPAPPTVPDPS